MLAPLFPRRSSRRGMCTDHRRVDDQVFHVGLIDEMLMDTLPYSVITPAGESLVDAVPFTVFGREHPPLRTSPSNPQYSFNEPPTFSFLPNVQACLTSKKLVYL